jgi:type IV secretion system protein TrbG
MKPILLKNTICGLLLTMTLYSGYGIASAAEGDIDTQIHDQQLVLQELNMKKTQQNNQELLTRLDSLENKVTAINKEPAYDAQGAVDALSTQVSALRDQVSSQMDMQNKIMDALKKIEDQQNNFQSLADTSGADAYQGSAATTKYLVNPGPGQGETVSYTQDAINSQGNSTMVFQYSPNQLYKIYCRRGYLTDLAFKQGEKINYVGGGDTAGWAVSNTDVDGVPHLYIKPIVEASTTNLIVTTDKHSYQIILNTSDWYNPMVRWIYEAETKNSNLIEQKKNERVVTGKINTGNVEDLDFNYEVSGKGDNKPIMVFSDGEKTYMQFKKIDKKQVPLFVRQRGHKEMALVNYTIKDNYYIVEKVFDMAQLKGSDDNTITIKHKN